MANRCEDTATYYCSGRQHMDQRMKVEQTADAINIVLSHDEATTCYV